MACEASVRILRMMESTLQDELETKDCYNAVSEDGTVRRRDARQSYIQSAA